MKEIVWNDGLLPGRRRPRLWIVKGKEIKKFQGMDIEGYCFVKSYDFEKNGDWSNTTYKILLFPGVSAIELCSPLHGEWGSRYEGWIDCANDLGLPIDLAQRIVRQEYPRAAERLDKIDSIMESIEEGEEEVEIKTVNVTKKDESFTIQSPKGPVALKPGVGPGEFVSWSTPSIEGEGAELIDVKTIGHGRRTVYTIRVAIS